MAPIIEIDGIECDAEKVKDAVRRCVSAMECINRWHWELLLGSPDSETIGIFLDELQEILRGEDAETDS